MQCTDYTGDRSDSSNLKGRSMPSNKYTRPTHSRPPPDPAAAAAAAADRTDDSAGACRRSHDRSRVSGLGAIWRGREAKLVECPAFTDSRPEFKTTYGVEPHAELLGFDDWVWELIPPSDLAASAAVVSYRSSGFARH
jgi:hypothetical protein